MFGQGTVYTFATVAPVATGFLVTPLVTRTLGPYEYGIVAVGLATIQIAQVLASWGLPAAITRNVTLEDSGPRGAAAMILLNALLVLGPILAAALVLCAAAFSAWAPGSLALALMLAAISSCVLAVFTSGQALVRGLSMASLFVRRSAAIAVIPPLSGLVLASAGEASSAAYLAGATMGQFVITVIAVGRLLRQHPPRWAKNDLSLGLRLGLPTVPHQVATIGATSLLVILVGLFDGQKAAGQMQLALIVGSAPILILGAFNNSWAVQVYRSTETARRSFVEGSTLAVSVFAVLLSWSAGLVSPALVEWLAPPGLDTKHMASAAIIIAASAPLMVLYLANMHLVFTAGATKHLAITTPLSLVIALTVAVFARLWMSTGGLVVMAGGVGVFYATQAALVAILRKRAGWRRLAVGRAAAIAVVGFLGSISMVTLQPPMSMRVYVLGALWLVVVAAVRLRSVRGAAG